MTNQTIERWHALLADRDIARLDDLLAENAVFHSPVVHRPQEGRELVKFYLTGAFHVLLNDSFHYVREVVGERDAVLEFVVEVDGLQVNGVDMIHWNEAGEIDDFKVMIRPLKAINLLHEKMRLMLESLKNG
jgi:hypothetical protein